MRKHLSYLLGLVAAAGVAYLFLSGMVPYVMGYLVLALGVLAPPVLAYFIQRDWVVPHWVILLWVGFMQASGGAVAQPQLLRPVGYLVCPDGHETTEVAIQTSHLYDGATNTSAQLTCQGAEGAVAPHTLAVLLVFTASYFLLFAPLLILAAVNARYLGRRWGPGVRLALSLAAFALLVAAASLLPGVPALLRSLVQAFMPG